MTALRQTKVEELIKTLEPHMDSSRQIDAFTLKRFKKEALDNLHAYPWAGHIALGMLALLEWDEEAMDRSYRNALRLRNDGFTHAHYANSLQLIGKYKEALEELLIAVEKIPENLSYLERAIEAAQSIGNYHLVKQLHTTFTQRAPGKTLSFGESAMFAEKVLAANGLNQELVAQCNEIAFSLLRRNHVRFIRTRMQTETQDNYIMFFIELALSEDAIKLLDDELGIELFDKVPDFHPDKYWVGYSKIGAE